MTPAASTKLQLDDGEVTISNPDKVFFPAIGLTKLDLVRYYLAVSDGALRGVRDRPMALKRFPNGAGEDFFFQKRAPKNLPPFVRTVELSFPSGRTADEVVVSNRAALAWAVNLGCIDLNPHPVREDDLEHPDELRVDLDPTPGVPWSAVRDVALVVQELLEEHALVGFPKTSGSRGMHVYVRIERRWAFGDVRRAALALAREAERRAPNLATSRWWKEERQGVFLDYNQNAKDRTVASAYSVRPVSDARVSAPLLWSEVPDAELEDFTVESVPRRLATEGDPGAGIDDGAYSLESLLELSARHEAEGLGDAPWPPHYARQAGEPPRVQPSKRRTGVPSPTGRRRSAHPLVTVAQSASKSDALAGLDRWRERHPGPARNLEEADVLVDQMRGRSSVWWRVRVNLRHVPEDERPEAEPPDPDYDPWAQRGAPDSAQQRE